MTSLASFGAMPQNVLSASGLTARDQGAVMGATMAVRANIADGHSVMGSSSSTRSNNTSSNTSSNTSTSTLKKERPKKPKRAPPRPPSRAPPPPPGLE